MPRTFIVGTRGSLLALTQCTQICEQLAQETGDQYQLKIIKTQGDQIVDKPLWQLEGKDFFTKELDAALLKGEVDLVVHSYKDLGSERPEGIELGAITKRSYAHDILLIRNEVKDSLTSKKELIVGTSSPRRIYNVENFLAPFLPNGENLKISTKTLRGNINSRIAKLKEGQYDAIVLALAGVERLALSPDSKKELTELISDLDYMVLPTSELPPAASQGALAIEYCPDQQSDQHLENNLKKVHHAATAACIAKERKAFASYGGGCHLAVGINVSELKGHMIEVHRGFNDDQIIEYTEFTSLDQTSIRKTNGTLFSGMPTSSDQDVPDKLIKKKSIVTKLSGEDHLFVTSGHTSHSITGDHAGEIWSAGTSTWKSLAKLGHWVNGSADSLGEPYVKTLLQAKSLALFNNRESDSLTVLSHDTANSILGPITACYGREIVAVDSTWEEQLKTCEHFYWRSFFQYETYVEKYHWIKDRHHYCGLGKTYDAMIAAGINVTGMMSYNALKTTLNK